MSNERALAQFRELHEMARNGKLSGEYRVLAESFLRSVAEMQSAGLQPQHKRREKARVRRALQLDLETPVGRARTMTFDLGLGGFSALLPTCPSVNAKVSFSIKLPRGRSASGTARIVATRMRNRAACVSFAFEAVEGHRELAIYLIDECLAELYPAETRAATHVHPAIDLSGRALVSS